MPDRGGVGSIPHFSDRPNSADTPVVRFERAVNASVPRADPGRLLERPALRLQSGRRRKGDSVRSASRAARRGFVPIAEGIPHCIQI